MPTLLIVLSALPLLSKLNMATTHRKIDWKPRKRDFHFNKQKLNVTYIPLAADNIPQSLMSALLLSAVAVVSDTVESVVDTGHTHCQAGHSLVVEVLPLPSTEASGFPLDNKRHILSYSSAK